MKQIFKYKDTLLKGCLTDTKGESDIYCLFGPWTR